MSISLKNLWNLYGTIRSGIKWYFFLSRINPTGSNAENMIAKVFQNLLQVGNIFVIIRWWMTTCQHKGTVHENQHFMCSFVGNQVTTPEQHRSDIKSKIKFNCNRKHSWYLIIHSISTVTYGCLHLHNYKSTGLIVADVQIPTMCICVDDVEI